ncbi:WbqC family protein [Actinoplanes sp. NPDC051859]|uniref:WbqC family protein n=1 Tax=Actinoplanes sp. NPDC051859 TaxID=3363909 RepID=UPI0037A87AA5
MAKLYAADQWIILDDVQFNRRDYQHRARLSDPRRPDHHQWLTLSAHLPAGRATLIRDVRLADPTRCQRRLGQMLYERYRNNAHWRDFEPKLQRILELFDTTDRVAAIAEQSARAMLEMLGWNGTIRRSSRYQTRPGRTGRLVDLTVVSGATHYLCGTGGARYLTPRLFHKDGIGVILHRIPTEGIWHSGRTESAISILTQMGGPQLKQSMQDLEAARAVTGRERG